MVLLFSLMCLFALFMGLAVFATSAGMTAFIIGDVVVLVYLIMRFLKKKKKK